MKSDSLHSRGVGFAACFLTALNSIVTAQVKDPAAAVEEQPIAQRIVGHWGIDRDQMLKAITKRVASEAGEAGVDPAQRELMTAMLHQMVAKMVIEFTADGIARVHSPEHEDDTSYKILKVDDATGEFSLEMTPPEEEAHLAEGKFNGSMLSLKSDEMELHFRRLSEAAAKTRLAGFKKSGGEGDEEKGQVDEAGDQDEGEE